MPWGEVIHGVGWGQVDAYVIPACISSLGFFPLMECRRKGEGSPWCAVSWWGVSMQGERSGRRFLGESRENGVGGR